MVCVNPEFGFKPFWREDLVDLGKETLGNVTLDKIWPQFYSDPRAIIVYAWQVVPIDATIICNGTLWSIVEHIG